MVTIFPLVCFGSLISATRSLCGSKAPLLSGTFGECNHTLQFSWLSILLIFILYIYRAILHDEKDYSESLVFNPDRFIPQEGKKLPPEPTANFGFGRRLARNLCLVHLLMCEIYSYSICPGRYLAVNSAWIAIASILSALTFFKAVDSDGLEVIEPSDIFTDAFIR